MADVVLTSKFNGPPLTGKVDIPITDCAGLTPLEPPDTVITKDVPWLTVVSVPAPSKNFVSFQWTVNPAGLVAKPYAGQFSIKFPTDQECVTGDTWTVTFDLLVQKGKVKFSR
jgi:hypothetical protein